MEVVNIAVSSLASALAVVCASVLRSLPPVLPRRLFFASRALSLRSKKSTSISLSPRFVTIETLVPSISSCPLSPAVSLVLSLDSSAASSMSSE